MSPRFKEGDKLYVITRRDISPGYQGVQSIHAATQFGKDHQEIHDDWFTQSNYLAWLSVHNESELFELLECAYRHGVRCTAWREPDVGNQVTAIALEPGDASAKLCRGLSLALENS